jgi:rhodanese-related sulfurtransferase
VRRDDAQAAHGAQRAGCDGAHRMRVPGHAELRPLEGGQPDSILFDVRGPAPYAAGHVPAALNMPHAKLVEARLRDYPIINLVVVHCARPHCNGAHRGAERLARLGRPVELTIGSVTG